MDRSVRAERVHHRRQVALANAEICNLRLKLENSSAADMPLIAPVEQRRDYLMLSIVAIALAAAVIGFSMWYVDPLHTWDGHVKPASQEAAAPTPPPPTMSSPVSAAVASSSESHAYSRLGQAVSTVPGASMPSVMNAANEWLGSTGEQACSVQSSRGEVSLVISGKSGDKPLLAALSRCASAVEHLTQPSPQR
jgi:hypothetical protein